MPLTEAGVSCTGTRFLAIFSMEMCLICMTYNKRAGKNHFHTRLSTRTRFETEPKGNSEMAYWSYNMFVIQRNVVFDTCNRNTCKTTYVTYTY